MSRKITNKTHSYVQKTLNEVIKIYNFSKKYVDEAIYINLWPHEQYVYNYHKQMIKASQEVIKDIKNARATVCFVYGTYDKISEGNAKHIIQYVNTSLKKLDNMNISNFLINKINHENYF